MTRYPRLLWQLLFLLPFLFVAEFSFGQVTADFTANVTSGCGPLIVSFENLSTGTGLSYQWNLGNGNTSVSENPAASYINPGTYTVTLTATGPGGSDTETKTAYITVFTPPTPDVSPSQTIGCYPFDVDFTDLSVVGDSPIASWSWDFGDGGTSTDQNPTHTYTTPGVFDVTLLLTDANGCAANMSFPDLIESDNNRPTAAFTGDPTVSCLPPTDVSFTNTSSGGTGNLTYMWDFGDGNTSTFPQPTNQYQTSGTFDVSLTVTDEHGCDDTQTEVAYVQIVDNVTIDFTANTTTACLGDQISFVDISSPTPVSWEWDFGDGSTSTDQFPDHLYTTPGTYEVSLTATYSASCQGTETKTGYITIGEIPFVDFTADTTSGCSTPFEVNFANQSIGTLDYEWTFGDGNTSTDENPMHAYADNGVYTVSLTGTNSAGCSNTVTETDYINVALTQADFLPDVFGFCQPLEVNFSDSSISGSNIVSWEWDFGDGGTSNLQNPTYTYQDTGIFDVSLVITNQLGCTDTLTRTNYIFVYTPPVANFLSNDTVICPGELDFTDLSQHVTDWYWDFGDGESSADQNPTHEFQDTGYYDITLIALNNGCSDTLIVEHMVYVSPPIASLDYSFSCDQPNQFIFNNTSYGYTSWNWILPDGSTSTDDPLTLNLSTPGQYIVHVTTANDTSGCVDMAGDTINVTQLMAGFDAANTQDCGPLHVNFTDQSVDAVSWKWFFGDGNATSTNENPSHTYSNIGTYSVTQVVTDVNGCTDTIIQPDLVTVTGSVVNFGIDSTWGCETLSVQFEDLTTPAGSVASYLWDFGDGGTSTGANPLHVYQNAGTYDVSLTITDIGGCTNTIEMPGLVDYIPYPEPAFEVDNTVGCIGDLFTFTNNSTGNAVNFLWNFGDGGTSTDANPTHSYSMQGTFSVTLTAFNPNGCDSSITQIALINIAHPDAGFSAFPTFAFCPPLLVSFTDQSSADAVSWFWTFGDGSSSNLQNPSHIYTESGLFSVQLVVTNGNGCTDTLLMPDLVELSGPTGDFSFFPDTVGCPPYDITFTSQTENVTTYTWDFGDGFLGSGETTTHTYTEIGSFIPTLILEDDNGCTFTYQSADTLTIQPLAVDAGQSETICHFDTVQLNATGGDGYTWSPAIGLDNPNVASPNASPDQTTQYTVTVTLGQCSNTDTVTIFVNPAPEVDFVATEVCFGTPTEFTDFSTIASPDSITTWNWDLAEGLSNDTNPTIIYSAPGTYTVTLALESSAACSGYGEGTVTVNPAPNAAFAANDTCLYGTTFLMDQSTVNPGSITNWNWQLGNGASTTQQNPSLTYSQDSVYQVTLVVTATGGCTDTITQPVEVFPLPNASAVAVNVCLGQSVPFGDSSTVNSGSIVSWDWTFGDGETSTDQHPSHVYGNDQTYVYSLVTTTDHGCQDETSGSVTVNPLPVSDFQMTSTASCVSPASVNLFNQSSGANQFLWSFGNGTTATTFHSTAIFDTIGQYTIQLLATNQFGCQDSSSQVFNVFPTVSADFDFTTPFGCEPWTVDFSDLSQNGITYTWDFHDGNGSALTDPTHTFENDGVYTVQLIVEGLGGCADTVTYQNLVNVYPNPVAQFEYSNIQDSIANGTIAFFNTSSAHVGDWWDFGDGDTDNSANTTHNYAFFGNKLVTLAIVDANGCVDTVQMYIEVNFFGGLYVPNAIIPQDPNHDVRIFQPKGTGLGHYHAMVFDKWGNLIWESTKLEEGSPTEYWDGTYRGELVPEGAYVWHIDAIFANGKIWDGMKGKGGKYRQTGTVTVIR